MYFLPKKKMLNISSQLTLPSFFTINTDNMFPHLLFHTILFLDRTHGSHYLHFPSEINSLTVWAPCSVIMLRDRLHWKQGKAFALADYSYAVSHCFHLKKLRAWRNVFLTVDLTNELRNSIEFIIGKYQAHIL